MLAVLVTITGLSATVGHGELTLGEGAQRAKVDHLADRPRDGGRRLEETHERIHGAAESHDGRAADEPIEKLPSGHPALPGRLDAAVAHSAAIYRDDGRDVNVSGGAGAAGQVPPAPAHPLAVSQTQPPEVMLGAPMAGADHTLLDIVGLTRGLHHSGGRRPRRAGRELLRGARRAGGPGGRVGLRQERHRLGHPRPHAHAEQRPCQRQHRLPGSRPAGPARERGPPRARARHRHDLPGPRHLAQPRALDRAPDDGGARAAPRHEPQGSGHALRSSCSSSSASPSRSSASTTTRTSSPAACGSA